MPHRFNIGPNALKALPNHAERAQTIIA